MIKLTDVPKILNLDRKLRVARAYLEHMDACRTTAAVCVGLDVEDRGNFEIPVHLIRDAVCSHVNEEIEQLKAELRQLGIDPEL